MFLVNSIPGLVLFDSGASRSFVSLAFSKKFQQSPKPLGYSLEVEIATDRSVEAKLVYSACELRVGEVRFLIDLIPLPIKEICVAVGMDWLDQFRAVIDCPLKQVRVQTPSGGRLVIQGERAAASTVFCSAARARRYIQRGATGYVAFVMDTSSKKTMKLFDVPVVRDFPEVFHEDLPGIPPER